MRPTPNPRVEPYRVTKGPLGSDVTYGNNGYFLVPGPDLQRLHIIASDGEGWEHVSISLASKKRLPTWTEMCHVKDLFWDEDECVVQYHPPKADYVNCHPATLHLWKPVDLDMPRSPHILVGPKNARETVEMVARVGKRMAP